jgi:hypothetical protein
MMALSGPAIAAGHAPPPATTASPAEPPQVAGSPVCTITDDRISNVSGLAATPSGFVVIDSGVAGLSNITVFHVNARCAVTNVDTRLRQPRDPSDLAVASDGTSYVADFGDVDRGRPSIAMWKLAGNDATTIYRMSFPDGAKDARAMLLGAGDIPVIIATNGSLYTPSASLQPEIPAPGVVLTRVGRFVPPQTDTANPLGVVGTTVVTGAARSPDGSKVVIRTYADAFEWDVADGNVVKAITTEQPRRTPLPNERDGEAIAYSSDGVFFYTASGNTKITGATSILRYTPYAPSTLTKRSQSGDSTVSWWAQLTLEQLNVFFAALAGLGVAVIIAGVIGIRRAGRRPSGHDEDNGDRYDDSRSTGQPESQPLDPYPRRDGDKPLRRRAVGWATPPTSRPGFHDNLPQSEQPRISDSQFPQGGDPGHGYANERDQPRGHASDNEDMNPRPEGPGLGFRSRDPW